MRERLKTREVKTGQTGSHEVGDDRQFCPFFLSPKSNKGPSVKLSSSRGQYCTHNRAYTMANYGIPQEKSNGYTPNSLTLTVTCTS